jgi:murein DD-endopeptidase MepM/ murein hydrolase activator NlpD
MLYRGDFSPTAHIRPWMLIVAVGAIAVLLLQTRTSPVVISSWNGGQQSAQQNARQGIQAQARPITGQAVSQSSRPREFASPDMPYGNPLQSARAVMTQGYGVGSHAPAAVWGAVDLAIDGNGDGQADPQGSLGTPIYATNRGTIKLTPNSYPAGNHVWVIGEHFKTGYSHLKGFAPGLTDGQVVEPGTLIGYLGSTGESSGPHLDYQVWKDGVNVNPLDYGVLAK